MKWKHRAVIEVSGFVLGNANQTIARALNANAEVLRECVQKIEELSKEVERLKKEQEE